MQHQKTKINDPNTSNGHAKYDCDIIPRVLAIRDDAVWGLVIGDMLPVQSVKGNLPTPFSKTDLCKPFP